MSYVDYLSLPRKPKALPFSDYEKLGKRARLYYEANSYKNKYCAIQKVQILEMGTK